VLLACAWWLNEQGEHPTQVGLAKQAGTDIKMTSQVVRSLERKGLLERTVDATDTRARRLEVSPAGAGLAVRAITVVEAVDARFFAKLPQRQALTFLRRLAGLREAANDGRTKQPARAAGGRGDH
jgi:DNA-binding MarR family transcriptional regulator